MRKYIVLSLGRYILPFGEISILQACDWGCTYLCNASFIAYFENALTYLSVGNIRNIFQKQLLDTVKD